LRRMLGHEIYSLVIISIATAVILLSREPYYMYL